METTIIKEKVKKIAKVIFHSSFVTLGLIATFFVGYYFNHIIELNKKKVPDVIKRSEVTIAIDEKSNVMIITKSDGTYTILQDSVGKSIFNMYAKDMFERTQNNEQ